MTLTGEKILLRPVALSDCTDRYVAWLNDPEVNRYLESRWTKQTIESVRLYVEGVSRSKDTHFFAMIDPGTKLHVGNIKLGPVNPHHRVADVSYFIGDRSFWGKGLATDAIRVVTTLAFETLALHRVQAGVHESNRGSRKALENAGFRAEGVWRKRLRTDSGWEDHLWYGRLAEDGK